MVYSGQMEAELGGPGRELDLTRDCVAVIRTQPRRTFVREACAFAKISNHPAWSDRELDQRCRDSLLSIVIDAWEDKAKDLGIRRMFRSGGWGYSLDEDARREIERSPEWKQYQDLLLDAFDAQSAREFSRSVRDESTTGAGERIAAFAQERKFGPGGGEPNRRATDMLQCLQNLAWQLRPDPGQGVVRVAGRIA